MTQPRSQQPGHSEGFPLEELEALVDSAHQACLDASEDLGDVHALLTACNTADPGPRTRASLHRIADALEEVAEALRSAADAP